MSEETGRQILTFPEPKETVGDVPCPVTFLGHRDGRFFLIDATGQLRGFVSRDMTALGLQDFCGMSPWPNAAGDSWPIDAWLVQVAPAYDRNGQPTGEFSAKGAGAKVQALCRRAGLFDPMTPQRSGGTFLGADGARAGGLLVHFGDRVEVWQGGRAVAEEKAGFADGGAVYVSAPRRAHKAEARPFTGAEAVRLVDSLKLWNWRDVAQADLMAGLIAAGFYGAAAHWRTHGAVAAPAGSGKTELAKFIGTAMGPNGEYSNDFTEAFIRQKLNGQASVLILDEMEAETHGGTSPASRALALVRRLSGDEGLRGGRGSSGGQAKSFLLSGSALVFGVTIPPMEAADRSRFITFSLLKSTGTQAELDKAKLWVAGAADGMRLRMLTLWPRFRPTFDVFAAALDADRGMQGRSANVFGIALAGRWLLEHDDPPTLDQAAAWVERMGEALTRHQHDSESTDVDSCIGKLLTSSVRAFRDGVELTVGELVAKAIHAVTGAAEGGRMVGPVNERLLARHASALALRRHGLRLELDQGRLCLAVANDHEALRRVFAGSRWQAGGWRESLMNWPTARPSAIGLKFLGKQSRAVLIEVETLAWEEADVQFRTQDDVADGYDTTR